MIDTGGKGMNWDWWKKFTKLFRRRITKVIGIDFGHGAVKVAEVSFVGGKPYLRTLAIVETPPVEWDEKKEDQEEQHLTAQPEVLRDMLSKALSLSGAKAKYAVIALGGRLSFMREVNFPKLPPEELAVAIKWDIPKYVPYDADSYEFDYTITGEDLVTGEVRVLIVAAPKEVVHQLTQIVRDVGLIPLAVEIESMAMYRTMSGADNSIVLDVGTAGTQISLFQRGNPVFTRVIQGGHDGGMVGENGDGLEEMVEDLVQEVRRTSQFFTQQNKVVNIDQVVITGTTKVEQIVTLLKDKVELPVVGHKSLAGLRVNPSITVSYLKKFGPQLAVAVGLAMRGDD